MAQANSVFADAGLPFRKVCCYVAAHPDDWQLFMNPSAFQDVADDRTKVIFLHMTSGDAGLGVGTGGRKHPLYLARENGTEVAVCFMADADGVPSGRIVSPMRLNGHSVHHVRYKNTVSYFLRLPDGNPGGSGYPETGNQSLQRLESGEIPVCSAIDGSAVYQGWTDLLSTLREIMQVEQGRSSALELHVAELDPERNPDDHSDHLATAKAALGAANTLRHVRRFHHVGYASEGLPENLTAEERDMKCAAYAVTVASMLAFDHGGAWRHYDHAYVGRTYVRVERGIEPDDAVGGPQAANR